MSQSSSIVAIPDTGMGNPTPLTGDNAHKWIRNFTLNGFIIYSRSEDRVKVELIEASLESPAVQLEGFTKEEEDAVMSLMEGNRGKDNEPKVGIWR